MTQFYVIFIINEDILHWNNPKIYYITYSEKILCFGVILLQQLWQLKTPDNIKLPNN